MIPRDKADRLLSDIYQAARDRGIRVRVEHVGVMEPSPVAWLVFMDETEEEYRERLRGVFGNKTDGSPGDGD